MFASVVGKTNFRMNIYWTDKGAFCQLLVQVVALVSLVNEELMPFGETVARRPIKQVLSGLGIQNLALSFITQTLLRVPSICF